MHKPAEADVLAGCELADTRCLSRARRLTDDDEQRVALTAHDPERALVGDGADARVEDGNLPTDNRQAVFTHCLDGHHVTTFGGGGDVGNCRLNICWPCTPVPQ